MQRQFLKECVAATLIWLSLPICFTIKTFDLILQDLIKCTSFFEELCKEKTPRTYIPFIPSIAPRTTCFAAASYTALVVVAGPNTRSE
jgi:hypothetical protein